ncbi:MAG: hypothetical protein QNJ14_11220 [Woeseiaceae bacterium]|nr:hypothetical protein [Woeseiaceae bacterium]
MLRTCLATLVILAHAAGATEPGQFDAGGQNKSGLTFSPDGRTAWWAEWDGEWGGSDRTASAIYRSVRCNDTWSDPIPAPFTGDYSDDEPFVSPDGRWLYFVSNRPEGELDDTADANIWRYNLQDDRLEFLPVNSTGTEYSPVVTALGTLYFASDRAGGYGRGDIYRADPSNDGFQEPQPLGPSINSRFGEWNVWVSPDGREMIFESSSRPENVSIPGDLYVSVRTSTGWSSAVPIGDLNSADSDLMARVHPDGETMYYTTAPIGGHARIVKVRWVNPIGAGKHLKSNTD